MLVYQNSTQAMVDLLETIMTSGSEVQSRGSLTKEITGVHLVIQNPNERCYLLPKRHDNIFHKIAESMWVLAGCNDAEWLSFYLPRALDYSDDGHTWRAAYGDRLRKHFGVDQIAECLRIIKADKYTRRAVMSIFDPAVDYCETKDVPCNSSLHFLIRTDAWGVEALHMYVTQRSSDLLWGFSGINTFEWSILHMMMAKWLDVPVGTLTYSITSLHLYEQHFNRANDIIKAFKTLTVYDHDVTYADGFDTPFEYLDYTLEQFFKGEDSIRHGKPCVKTGDTFLDNCLQMLAVYIKYTKCKKLTPGIVDTFNTLPDNDFKVAAYEYVKRHAENDPLFTNMVLDDVSCLAMSLVL